MSLLARPAMNDTKWREVWAIVADLGLRVEVAFVADRRWNAANAGRLHGPFSPRWVGEDGLGDPGIGGPFRYSALAWLRVPRVGGNDVDEFCRRVAALGELPLNVAEDHAELRGYLEPPTHREE